MGGGGELWSDYSLLLLIAGNLRRKDTRIPPGTIGRKEGEPFRVQIVNTLQFHHYNDLMVFLRAVQVWFFCTLGGLRKLEGSGVW